MYSVMIVDDDFINRTAIKNMLEWELLGFQVVCEARNGAAAIEYLQEHDIHVVITDMKMPVMDGVELIRKMQKKDVVIIALSSFDEYDLVRESFKLGVEDYLLKSNLDSRYLRNFMEKVRKRLEKKEGYTKAIQRSCLQEHLAGEQQVYEDGHSYCIIVIDIPDIVNVRKRFGNLHDHVMLPMTDLIRQLPEAQKRCEFAEHSEVSLMLRYHAPEIERSTVERFCVQIMNVLKNYMNLEITQATGDIHQGIAECNTAINEALLNLKLRYLYGEYQIYTQSREYTIKAKELEEGAERYEKLLDAFRNLEEDAMLKAEERLFADFRGGGKEEMVKACLKMIYYEADMLNNSGDSIWNITGKCISFEEKLNRLEREKDCIIWMYNFNRYLLDYLQSLGSDADEFSFRHIGRYIMDNYADEGLSLREAASIAGMNESYFSRKFKCEFGVGFSEYVKNLRMKKAIELMRTTKFKVYEICEAVGYSSVEHFTRVFTAYAGLSPGKYMGKYRRE